MYLHSNINLLYAYNVHKCYRFIVTIW